MEKRYNLIEEEVQDIIGAIPPKTVRYGNAVILFILMLLFGISFMISCKDTEEAKIQLERKGDCYIGEAIVPAKGYGNLYIGQNVQIAVDCFPSSEYGFMQGTICFLDTLMKDDGYKTQINIPVIQPSFRSEKRIQEMSGKAFFIIKEYRLIEKLFNHF